MTRGLWRLLVTALLLTAGLNAVIAQPASAEPCGGSGNNIDGCKDAGGIVVRGSHGNGGSSSQGNKPIAPPIKITVTCGTSAEAQLTGLGDSAPLQTKETCADQTAACTAQSTNEKRKLDPVVTVEKQDDGTWQYSGNECVENGPARVTPEIVRQQAVRLIPTARVGLAPRGTTLVNIETVMWADAPRQRELAPVTILGRRVVVRIVLDHVVWRFGDGQSDPTGPAGKAYDNKRDPCREKLCTSYFGHVYRKTGTVTVSATASWHASFSVGGAAPVDIPGTVDGPASQANIGVKQARAVLVPNPDEQR